MKKRKINGLLQVFCKDKAQKLKALTTFPRFLYEKQGKDGQTFLYFNAL